MKAGYLCCKDLVKVGDLNCWCKCMFSRDESLQQVCEKLPKDITTLAKYALFMHHIPMVSYLFYYYLSVLFPGVCQVNLLMSLSRFKKYNCEVYAHIDDQSLFVDLLKIVSKFATSASKTHRMLSLTSFTT